MAMLVSRATIDGVTYRVGDTYTARGREFRITKIRSNPLSWTVDTGCNRRLRIPKPRELPDRFRELDEATENFGETRDCGVKAVALATGCSYADAHDACRRQGRIRRCGMNSDQYIAAIEELGFDVERVYTRHKTVRSFQRHTRRGVYLIRVARHVLVFRDGTVQDWTNGRMHRIQDIWKIS